jgi:hypothetical protein
MQASRHSNFAQTATSMSDFQHINNGNCCRRLA